MKIAWPKFKNVRSEKGAALVISLLVLFALTIIGLSAIVTSNLSSDVAGNLKTQTQTYHAAEACLYYQIRRIKLGGPTTTALNFDLGNGLTCDATVPSSTGGFAGGGSAILDGYSMEEGAGTVAYVSYFFTVTGNGPRNTTSVMDVTIKLPFATGT
jgi:hypothetical protein